MTNSAFYSMPNPQPQTERAIGSFESHLSYDFSKLRCWGFAGRKFLAMHFNWKQTYDSGGIAVWVVAR